MNLYEVLRQVVNYCENHEKGYKECMRAYHDKGLGYTVSSLVKNDMKIDEEKETEWERLTRLAMGDPETLANHIFDEVAEWCTEHSGDDPLSCLEDHDPWHFSEVAEAYFAPNMSGDLREAILHNIEEEDWSKAADIYDKLWRDAYKDLKNLYKEA